MNTSESQKDKSQEIKLVNEALRRFYDGSARWWEYNVSHSTFTLVIGDEEGDGNIVLYFSGCQSISGPVSWDKQEVKILFDPDSLNSEKLWLFTAVDENVGFELKSNMFTWKTNLNLINKLKH